MCGDLPVGTGKVQGSRIWELRGGGEVEVCRTSSTCPVDFQVMMVLAWLQLREKPRRYMTQQ